MLITHGKGSPGRPTEARVLQMSSSPSLAKVWERPDGKASLGPPGNVFGLANELRRLVLSFHRKMVWGHKPSGGSSILTQLINTGLVR